jgi:hypothetical protein
MPSVHEVLTTPNSRVHDVLNALLVYEVLTIDN